MELSPKKMSQSRHSSVIFFIDLVNTGVLSLDGWANEHVEKTSFILPGFFRTSPHVIAPEGGGVGMPSFGFPEVRMGWRGDGGGWWVGAPTTPGSHVPRADPPAGGPPGAAVGLRRAPRPQQGVRRGGQAGVVRWREGQPLSAPRLSGGVK